MAAVLVKFAMLTWMRAVGVRLWVEDREHFDHIRSDMGVANRMYVDVCGSLALYRLMGDVYEAYVVEVGV